MPIFIGFILILSCSYSLIFQTILIKIQILTFIDINLPKSHTKYTVDTYNLDNSVKANIDKIIHKMSTFFHNNT